MTISTYIRRMTSQYDENMCSPSIQCFHYILCSRNAATLFTSTIQTFEKLVSSSEIRFERHSFSSPAWAYSEICDQQQSAADSPGLHSEAGIVGFVVFRSSLMSREAAVDAKRADVWLIKLI